MAHTGVHHVAHFNDFVAVVGVIVCVCCVCLVNTPLYHFSTYEFHKDSMNIIFRIFWIWFATCLFIFSLSNSIHILPSSTTNILCAICCSNFERNFFLRLFKSNWLIALGSARMHAVSIEIETLFGRSQKRIWKNDRVFRNKIEIKLKVYFRRTSSGFNEMRDSREKRTDQSAAYSALRSKNRWLFATNSATALQFQLVPFVCGVG